MAPRLGLGTYACAWAIGVPSYERLPTPMDAFGFLRFADELGLRVVQIADNLPLHVLTDDERGRVREEAVRRGIAIEAGTRGIETDHLRQYVNLAAFFHSPILRVVVDTATHHPTPDEVVALIRAVLPLLEAANVTLAVENHDRFEAQTLAGIIRTLDHPNVGICLDTVNSFGAMEKPDIVIEALGQYVVNLHVKEFVIKRVDHQMGFIVTGAPAGQGMLNVPELLSKLNGRSFNAIIESWLPPEATISATVVKEATWARESVKYLRGYIKD